MKRDRQVMGGRGQVGGRTGSEVKEGGEGVQIGEWVKAEGCKKGGNGGWEQLRQNHSSS